MNKTSRIKYIVVMTASVLIAIAIFSCFFVFGANGLLGKVVAAPAETVKETNAAVAISQKDEKEVLTETIEKYEKYLASPYLLSVTKESPLPSDYDVTLAALDAYPQISLETQAAQSLNSFIADAKAANISFTVYGGYRTEEQQQQSYDKKRSSVIAAGFTDEKIIEQKTQLAVALPGYSEHQTGLAVDIAQTTSDIASEIVLTEFYKYAKENIYKYGFIFSYPENSDTGYDFMPWHLRYIGDSEQAKYITEKNMSLKTYISYLNAQITSSKQRLEELQSEK